MSHNLAHSVYWIESTDFLVRFLMILVLLWFFRFCIFLQSENNFTTKKSFDFPCFFLCFFLLSSFSQGYWFFLLYSKVARNFYDISFFISLYSIPLSPFVFVFQLERRKIERLQNNVKKHTHIHKNNRNVIQKRLSRDEIFRSVQTLLSVSRCSWKQFKPKKKKK